MQAQLTQTSSVQFSFIYTEPVHNSCCLKSLHKDPTMLKREPKDLASKEKLFKLATVS